MQERSKATDSEVVDKKVGRDVHDAKRVSNTHVRDWDVMALKDITDCEHDTHGEERNEEDSHCH